VAISQAYYGRELITTVKSFRVHTPDLFLKGIDVTWGCKLQSYIFIGLALGPNVVKLSMAIIYK
jgi:hypothetical protein